MEDKIAVRWLSSRGKLESEVEQGFSVLLLHSKSTPRAVEMQQSTML